jgi:hypothetical protein
MANEYRIPILTSFQSLPRPKLHWGALALVGVCLACDEAAVEAPPRGNQPASPRPGSRLIEVHAELGSATAFDLISGFDGAKLVWAPKAEPAEVRAQAIAKDGLPKGASVRLLASSGARGRATDLVAVQLDRGVAVAWIEQLGNEARASAFISSDSRRAPDVVDLGPAWPTRTEHRGNIALAGGRDYALVFVRGVEEPCSEGQTECFGFGLYRLEPEHAANARGLPLSVPVPCSEHSTSLAIVEGRWHYSVCTLLGAAPVTTVFNIQFEPEYAAAEQLLPGCRPLGLFEHADEVWLSADCAGTRRITNATGTPRTSHDLSKLTLDCKSGEPTLTGGDFSLRLGPPRGQLHALLGPPWVPPHARAVWTGGALVVASEHDGSVRLTRYACE